MQEMFSESTKLVLVEKRHLEKKFLKSSSELVCKQRLISLLISFDRSLYTEYSIIGMNLKSSLFSKIYSVFENGSGGFIDLGKAARMMFLI